MAQKANGDEHHPGRAVVYGWKSGMGGSGAEGGIVSEGVAQVHGGRGNPLFLL